jgi:hypothetical protein
MASADYSSPPKTPFPGNLQDRRCPACEALYRDTEELVRKIEATKAYADRMEQQARAQEAERDRLLRVLASRLLRET